MGFGGGRPAGGPAAAEAAAGVATGGDFAFAADAATTGRMDRAAEGERAVTLSTTLRQAKEARSLGEAGQRIVRVGEKQFLLVGGTYVDTAFEEDMEILKVQWFSDAYFSSIEALPELADYLALGDSVVVVVGEKALAVSGEGREEMSVEAVREFFEE
jgi:hypothetical protein